MNNLLLPKPQTFPQKTELAKATYEVFLSRGYDEATIQAVAERLRLSPELLQQSYSSKYELWYAALCQASEGLQQAVEAVTAKSPLEQLHQACLAFVEWAKKNPDAYRFLTMPRSDSMPEPDEPAPGVILFRVQMQRMVKRCIKEGIFAQQPVEAATQGLWCALHGVSDFLINIRRIPWVPELPEVVIANYVAGMQKRSSSTEN
ncbi:TetR/AcrR family transcriptional regulator [Nostocaceae cyanobacterium CENA357]|uniref:TetR/AcrR family transcriptional regulator n=2 Tax=Atlanticothrix TaxID=2840441 RepID=A0A8J7HJ30_9CYAN|nr:TetR/AcrR family transcriptional regulator [Atlanticothrix silvestris CENA357]